MGCTWAGWEAAGLEGIAMAQRTETQRHSEDACQPGAGVPRPDRRERLRAEPAGGREDGELLDPPRFAIPSPALLERKGTRFCRAVETYAEANGVPVVRSRRETASWR